MLLSRLLLAWNGDHDHDCCSGDSCIPLVVSYYLSSSNGVTDSILDRSPFDSARLATA